jgi:hypothetical protein
LYLQYGKADEAKVIYGTLIELEDRDPMMVMTYAYCMARCGHYSIALHYLDSVCGGDFMPKARSAYRLLRGNVLWHLGKDEEARHELNLFLATERKRAMVEPERNSVIVQSVLDRLLPPTTRRGGEREVETTQRRKTRDGIWRRLLKFIAKWELRREHSKQI